MPDPISSSVVPGSPVRELKGNEDVVWFMNGDEFTGATAEWLRTRLRLDPAEHDCDLENGGPNLQLDGELVEDLDLDVILGTGPNDGELVAIEGPGESSASACIRGGWLESIAPDVSHDITWVGLEPDLKKVVEDWLLDWAANWGDIDVTFDRLDD